MGGSTNMYLHLLAVAREADVPIGIERIQQIGERVPLLANLQPHGPFAMGSLHLIGGVPVVMKELLPLLHRDAITVSGKTVAENVENVECFNRDVIRPLDAPLHATGGTVVLHGNLCPRGAVIKQTAASAHLLQHRGKAYVFENYQEMHDGVDRMDLPIDKDTILVMKNGGPIGAPGFPEWGHIPMPKVLLAQGISDCVRISDARMSGTSFGTVVLHIAPESAIGGPLAIVRTGDEIDLDVEGRGLNLLISSDEFAARMAQFQPAKPHYNRGYGKLFLDHVTQADEGCDFDFLHHIPE